MDTKNIVVAVLILIALAFAIAGTVTPYATVKATGYDNKYKYLEICTTVGSAAETCTELDKINVCDKFKSVSKAVIAFAILMSVCVGVAAIIAVVRLFKEDLTAGSIKYVFLGLVGGTAVAGLIAWAMAFAQWNMNLCPTGNSVKDTTGVSMGGSPPCLLIGFAFAVGGLIAELVMNSSAAPPTKPAEPSAAAAA
jgi:hypothetical protein